MTWTIAAVLLLSVTSIGCSDDSSATKPGASGSDSGAASGSAGTAASGGKPATSGGGQSTGTGGGAGSATTFVNTGTCGERGKANATATAYDGTAELYIVGEGGLGMDVCTIRYDVARVGAGQDGCKDPLSGAACAWSHLVEYSNPTVVLNLDGACDASDGVPPLDAAGRAELDGMRISRGFSAAAGHGDSLMKYDDALQKWIAVGRVSWSEASGNLEYDISSGFCNYGR
jgi:hypothetical protein